MENNNTTTEKVTITREEFDSLWEDRDLLRALEAAGVDNWCGFDYAHEILNGEYE